MKGYWIEIVNNLLEPKHRKAMKESVWLFMWLLDKITSITEEGIGKVLGGKPITYEEVNKDLEVPERTYRDWVARLKKHQYITVKRAPNGLIFYVNKAKKRFGQRASDVQKSAYREGKSDMQKTQVGCAENAGSDVQKTQVAIRQYSRQYKTRQYSFNKKKPFYENQPMRWKQNRWWVIPADGGPWLEFAGDEKDIVYK